jgi:hypothetical protein
VEGVLLKLANIHHVDHECGLIGLSWINHVEVSDAVMLDVVGEEVVDGILVRKSYTLQPEGIGLRQVLH